MTRVEAHSGRPRDPSADRAIMSATLQMLGEVGYSALSIEGVASRAGVGKTTIYRRYPSKSAMVVAAVGSLTDIPRSPDTGDTRRDILELLTTVWLRLVRGPGLTLLGTFMVEANRNRELFDEFRRSVIEPRREPIRATLERGQATGQVRRDVDLEVATDLLVGPLLAAMVTGGRADEATVVARIDAVWLSLLGDGSVAAVEHGRQRGG